MLTRLPRRSSSVSTKSLRSRLWSECKPNGRQQYAWLFASSYMLPAECATLHCLGRMGTSKQTCPDLQTAEGPGFRQPVLRLLQMGLGSTRILNCVPVLFYQ
jgi:hypothetical protein